MTIETARDAAAAGDQIVLGAPNVMRGKSHLGWINASDMIAQGLCSVLASEYYYPAPLLAAFRLAEDGVALLQRHGGSCPRRLPAPWAWTTAAASDAASALT